MWTTDFSRVAWETGPRSYHDAQSVYLWIMRTELEMERFSINNAALRTGATEASAVEFLLIEVQLPVAGTDRIIFRRSWTTAKAIDECLSGRRSWCAEWCHRAHNWRIVDQHKIASRTHCWPCGHQGGTCCCREYQKILTGHQISSDKSTNR